MYEIKSFKASWCAACRAIAPMLTQIATEYPQIKFITVDTDENPDEGEQYDIRSLPTLLFIKNGKVVDKQKGALTKTAMKTKIENLIK